MSDTTQKPPTLRVGVSGFSAFEAKPGAPDGQAIDWQHLEALPAFEMFLAETRQKAQRSADFYDQYCQWHAIKGYWPNETPKGELIDGD